jgi:hypothetical protein
MRIFTSKINEIDNIFSTGKTKTVMIKSHYAASWKFKKKYYRKITTFINSR